MEAPLPIGAGIIGIARHENKEPLYPTIKIKQANANNRKKILSPYDDFLCPSLACPNIKPINKNGLLCPNKSIFFNTYEKIKHADIVARSHSQTMPLIGL